ncbi:MAG: hypothetical protein ABR576_08125 [Thermoanaerobaculia bacterium]
MPEDPPPDRTRFGEILLYVLGFLAAIALAAFLVVWLLRHL